MITERDWASRRKFSDRIRLNLRIHPQMMNTGFQQDIPNARLLGACRLELRAKASRHRGRLPVRSFADCGNQNVLFPFTPFTKGQTH